MYRKAKDNVPKSKGRYVSCTLMLLETHYRNTRKKKKDKEKEKEKESSCLKNNTFLINL